MKRELKEYILNLDEAIEGCCSPNPYEEGTER